MSDLILQRIGEAATPTRCRETHGPGPVSALQQRLEERQFCLMERGFRSTGGIVGGDEVARLLQGRTEQPFSMLARWIVAREAVSFEWRARTLLPLFQFELSDMSLRPDVTMIIRELSDVFDNWTMALWFAETNTWLGDAVPAELVALDAHSVLHAARADRFVARG